jgi:hypothetical protein
VFFFSCETSLFLKKREVPLFFLYLLAFFLEKKANYTASFFPADRHEHLRVAYLLPPTEAEGHGRKAAERPFRKGGRQQAGARRRDSTPSRRRPHGIGNKRATSKKRPA